MLTGPALAGICGGDFLLVIMPSILFLLILIPAAAAERLVADIPVYKLVAAEGTLTVVLFAVFQGLQVRAFLIRFAAFIHDLPCLCAGGWGVSDIFSVRCVHSTVRGRQGLQCRQLLAGDLVVIHLDEVVTVHEFFRRDSRILFLGLFIFLLGKVAGDPALICEPEPECSKVVGIQQAIIVLADDIIHFGGVLLSFLDSGQNVGLFLHQGHILAHTATGKEPVQQRGFGCHALLVLGTADRQAVTALVGKVGSPHTPAGEAGTQSVGSVVIDPGLDLVQEVQIQAQDVQRTLVVCLATVGRGIADGGRHPAFVSLDILGISLALNVLVRSPGQQVGAPLAALGVPVTGVVGVGGLLYLSAAFADVGGHWVLLSAYSNP